MKQAEAYGVTLAEYGAIIGLIVLLAIPALAYLGNTESGLLGNLMPTVGADSISAKSSADSSFTSVQAGAQAPSGNNSDINLSSSSAGGTSSPITYNAGTGKIALNLPNASGAGSNTTSVEGQLLQAPMATSALSDQITQLANQLVAQPNADPQLVAMIRQLGSTGQDLAAYETEYNTVPDGVAYHAILDFINFGAQYQAMQDRINTLAQQNPSGYNYGALGGELSQLSAVISKVMAQNYLYAPITTGVNVNYAGYTPPSSATNMIDLLQYSSTPDVLNGNITNAQQMTDQINSTMTLFNQVPVNTSSVNRLLAPTVTTTASNQITNTAQIYQSKSP